MSSKENNTMLTEQQKSVEYLQQLRKGTYNNCFMCGKTGHFARECEADENWKQEVDNGCWTFWYCDYCGYEFMEKKECETHEKCCNYNVNSKSSK